jgi:hypothetical protein
MRLAVTNATILECGVVKKFGHNLISICLPLQAWRSTSHVLACRDNRKLPREFGVRATPALVRTYFDCGSSSALTIKYSSWTEVLPLA